MNTWVVVSVFFVLLLLGLARKLSALSEEAERLQLINGFLSQFIEWCNGEARDRTIYNDLLDRSEAVQIAMGSSAVIDMKPPFANYMHRNYAVILNEIPAIAEEFAAGDYQFNTVTQRIINQRIQLVDGCLRRVIGTARDEHQRLRRRLLNPAVLLCAGVGTLLGLPTWFLNETGVISADRRSGIENGWLFRMVTAALSLFALFATLVSFVTDWGPFIEILKRWK